MKAMTVAARLLAAITMAMAGSVALLAQAQETSADGNISSLARYVARHNLEQAVVARVGASPREA
jgi:hypothetical protein